jgi:hypothetical protein
MIGTRVLRGAQITEYCEKHGLCPLCGIVQTHTRGFFRKPITTVDESGKYTVYKGYCIQPTCNSLEMAQELLGERSGRRQRRQPSSANLTASPSSHSSASLQSPRSRKMYQPPNVFKPDSIVSESLTQKQYSVQHEPTPNGREIFFDGSPQILIPRNPQYQENNLNRMYSRNAYNESNIRTPTASPPLESPGAGRQEYQHHQKLRQVSGSNSPMSYSSSENSDRVEAPTSAVARLHQAGDRVFAPNLGTTRVSSNEASCLGGGIRPSGAPVPFLQPAKAPRDSSMGKAFDKGRGSPVTTDNNRITNPAALRSTSRATSGLDGFPDSSLVGSNVNQVDPPGPSPYHPDMEELMPLLADGDYISFINRLHQKVGNTPGPVEKALFLEGSRMFRFHVVRDQVSRPEGVVLSFSDGWVKDVKTPLATFNGDKEVVMSSLLTFLSFSTLPGLYRKHTIKKDGVGDTLEVLNNFKMDEEVSNLASSLILSLSLDEKQGFDVKHPNIALLVRRLVSVVSSGEFGKDFAVRALFHLACQRRKIDGKTVFHVVESVLAASEGNIRALFDALNEQGAHEASVEAALALLWRMSHSVAETHLEELGLFQMSGSTIDSLIRAMDSFDSIAIREACCGILANLSKQNCFPSDSSHPVFLSMVRFLEDEANIDEGLATCALHAICNMLENRASRTALLSDDRVVTTILSLLQRYGTCKNLVEYGCLAIGHAARDDNSVKEWIMSLGGFDLVKDVFDEYVEDRDVSPSSASVFDASLCAIACLSGCHSGAKAVVESNLFETFETLLAVDDEDRDFKLSLQVIVNNAQRGASNGFSVGSHDTLRQNLERFSQLVETATRKGAGDVVVTLFQGVIGSSQSNLDAAVGRQEGFASILQAMARFIDSASVQENGCALLAEIYFHLSFRLAESPDDDGPWAPRNQRETLASIHSAMNTHRGQASIQHFGCLVMLNLFSAHPEFESSSIDIERCFSEILDCLHTHEADRKAQKSGIAALGATASIASQQDLERWIVQIVEQIFSSLQKFAGDYEVWPIALDALLILQEKKQGKESIRTKSNISILLHHTAWESHEVAGRSSAILGAICQSDYQASSYVMEYPDAMQKLLLGMTSNEQDLQIQINLTSILASLVNFGDDVVFEQIVLYGGVTALCKSLSLHTSSRKFVLLACRVLSSVIPLLDVSTIASERNLLIESMTKAAVRYVDDADVETAIFDALGSCCQKDDYVKQALVEETQISTVVSAMKLNLGSFDLQRSGCSLLYILSVSDSAKEIIGSFGSIQAIVSALLAHNESTAVQKEGLAALQKLATASSNKPRIAEAGGENAVIWSMWIHYRDPQVLSIAMSALNNIAVNSQTSVAQMNEQALRIILGAMQHFPADKRVQKNACSYLKNCSYLEANLRRMNEKGEPLIALLLRAASTFPEQCTDRAMGVVNKLRQL